MANVFDVAEYILQQQGAMTTMKLQKLVYYSQAWSLVWDSEALFDECIEAWASGPVVPLLYKAHRREYLIKDLPLGNSNSLIDKQRETINAVLGAYGDKPAQWLADLTHMEKPWLDARGEVALGENCENEISLASMEEYYSSLSPGGEPV
ncbi:Panacea domain-containing protein [Chloroflexota bacterium]